MTSLKNVNALRYALYMLDGDDGALAAALRIPAEELQFYLRMEREVPRLVVIDALQVVLAEVKATKLLDV